MTTANSPASLITRYLLFITRWVCAFIVVVAMHAGQPAFGDDAQPSAAENESYQDLLFLDETRPIVIRLHLIVDGRPFVSVWQDYVQQLFRLADRNGDKKLSEEETGSPAPSEEALGKELFAILSLPGLAQADLAPPDGELSFDEFASFLRHHRGGPFQIPPSVARRNPSQRQTNRAGQSTNPGRVLFETLDKDRDGRISRQEIGAGSESIRKFDFDGDGASSLDELDHQRSPFGRTVDMPNSESGVPVLALSSERPSRELIRTVIDAYRQNASPDTESLSLSQLGMSAEASARYDADGNGQLDRNELRYWLKSPQPDVELTVRIGERARDMEAVTVTTPTELESLTVKMTEFGLVSLVSGDVHLEIGVGPDRRNAKTLRQSYARRFKQSDRDSNGYLEQDEVAGNALFEASFHRFDQDGDGKLFEAELLAVVEAQIIASLSRTGMRAANRGKDLFEILDTNRDRRVSRRELIGAEHRFDLWDIDTDDALEESEVPQLYQLVFDRGSPHLPGEPASEAPASLALAGAEGQSRAASGPTWFRKMDRNGDGDVSRREFLGPLRQFDQWDTDGNGLIDPMEGKSAAPDK